MGCDCCDSSSSTCKKASSSSESSCDESSSSLLCYKKKNKKAVIPTAWEPGVEGYFGERDYRGGVEACHNAGCKTIRKPYIKKNKHCYPRLKTTSIRACEVSSCLLDALCLKARGAEIRDLNVQGRIMLNGRDINNNEESVILSNYIGQTEVPPRLREPLVLPQPIPLPTGVFSPLSGIEMPFYVSLYHITDKQGIRNLSELKQLFSKLLLLNTSGNAVQLAFVLFIYSSNGIPLREEAPERSYTLHCLDIDIQFIPPGGLATFEVNWNSWRSSLNVIRDANEVAIFTSVLPIDAANELNFLRAFRCGAESLSFRIFAVYNDYCVKDRCEEEECYPEDD